VKPRQRGGPRPLAAFVTWNNTLFNKFCVTEVCPFVLEKSKQKRGRKTVGRNPSNTATFLETEEHVDFK